LENLTKNIKKILKYRQQLHNNHSQTKGRILNYFQAGRTNISNTYNGQEYFSFSANDSCISEILTSVQNENFAWDFFINIGAIETSQRGDQNIVIETYCPSNGQVDFTSTFYATSYSCPNGCDNGACVN